MPEGVKAGATAKRSNGDSTKSRILTEVAQLFCEKGFHGTSVDDITKAANISKGAFYWHYKSKDDLLKRFLEEWEQRFLDGLINAVNAEEVGFREKFNRLYRFTIIFALNNRELCLAFDTLSGELVGAKHPIEGQFKRMFDKYQDHLRHLMEEGQRERQLRSDLDSQLLALLLISFHHGILFQWSMNRHILDSEAFLDAYRNILEAGMFLPENT